MTPLQRYKSAHYHYYCTEYPSVVADGHYPEPRPINTTKEKGLKDFIVNFINWSGYRATDMRKAGGILTKQAEVQRESGTILIVNKFKATGVKKGTADISSTIKNKLGYGISVQWEIKINKDRPSDHQLDEQERERKAGGEYIFVKTPEEFLHYFDIITNG